MKKKPHNKSAVALHYDGVGAPRVSTKRFGEVAERILDDAPAHSVPLDENDDLVEILARLRLDEEIPDALYRTVAEIIGFLYGLKGRYPKGYEALQQT